MEHFSKQVADARQVFIGFPKDKPEFFSLVSVGFEKCLPDFLVERDSYPEIGRSNANIEYTTIEFIMGQEKESSIWKAPAISYAQVLYLATKSETIIKYQALQSHQ